MLARYKFSLAHIRYPDEQVPTQSVTFRACESDFSLSSKARASNKKRKKNYFFLGLGTLVGSSSGPGFENK